MKKLLLLMILILMSFAPCFGEQSWTAVSKDGITTVSGGKYKSQVAIKLFSRVVDIPAEEKHEDESHSTNCTYSIRPCREIYKLEISINDTQIRVPRSAFADLGDITNARIVQDAQGVTTVQLTGGDGDEGYYAYLRLDRKSIVERDIYSIAGPKAGPLEVTKYHSVVFP